METTQKSFEKVCSGSYNLKTVTESLHSPNPCQVFQTPMKAYHLNVALTVKFWNSKFKWLIQEVISKLGL